MDPELTPNEISAMHSTYTIDTHKVISWMTANGSPDGVARTNLHKTIEGRTLANELCVKNMLLPLELEEALQNAIDLRTAVWWNSCTYGDSTPKAREENKTHEAFIVM